MSRFALSRLGPLVPFYRHYRWLIINLLAPLDRYGRYARYSVLTSRFSGVLSSLDRLANIKEQECAFRWVDNIYPPR